MSTAIEEPRLLHALPGRMRVHLAGWPHEGPYAVETRLRQVRGIHSVQVNPLTGNVLIHFDPTATDEHAILVGVRTLQPDSGSHRGEILPSSPPVVPHRHRRSSSAPRAILRVAGDPHVAGPAPILRDRRPRLLSLETLDLIVKGACIVLNLILADGALGLLFAGVEVVRLFMDIVGAQSARCRDEVWQAHSLFMLTVPGGAGALDAPAPMTRGRTGCYA